MTANFVSRQMGYRKMADWFEGQNSACDYFRPVETYEARLDALFKEIYDLGFQYIDLWVAHLHYSWDFENYLPVLKKLLDRYGFEIVSYAGGFGGTVEQFERACLLCASLNLGLLGGRTPLLFTERKEVVRLLKQHNVNLAFENHPEKTPKELIGKIGDGDQDCIGISLDTGWFASHGFDSAAAIRDLKKRIMHVHLKDVLEKGTHNCCAYGEGIVDIERCGNALKQFSYRHGISVEIEKEQGSPLADIRKSRDSLLNILLSPVESPQKT